MEEYRRQERDQNEETLGLQAYRNSDQFKFYFGWEAVKSFEASFFRFLEIIDMNEEIPKSRSWVHFNQYLFYSLGREFSRRIVNASAVFLAIVRVPKSIWRMESCTIGRRWFRFWRWDSSMWCLQSSMGPLVLYLLCWISLSRLNGQICIARSLLGRRWVNLVTESSNDVFQRVFFDESNILRTSENFEFNLGPVLDDSTPGSNQCCGPYPKMTNGLLGNLLRDDREADMQKVALHVYSGFPFAFSSTDNITAKCISVQNRLGYQ